MFRKLFFSASIFFVSLLQADIIEIQHIDDIRPYVIENALCLFDIDDTLIDNPFSLGSPPWRSWVKSKLSSYNSNFVLYDALTLYIAQHAPYKTVEPTTAPLIADLQDRGHTALAFTARGRTQWYTTDIDGVDRFTHAQLNHVGIDFKKTALPPELQNLEPTYFDNGIIFAQHIKKGDLLTHLFKDLKYCPSLIIFIDDKLDQVQSVEAAVKQSGIPYIGFWYRRSEMDRKNFNAMTANIQMESLLFNDEIISDEKAATFPQVIQQENPEAYLKKILEHTDFNLLTPTIPEEVAF